MLPNQKPPQHATCSSCQSNYAEKENDMSENPPKAPDQWPARSRQLATSACNSWTSRSLRPTCLLSPEPRKCGVECLLLSLGFGCRAPRGFPVWPRGPLWKGFLQVLFVKLWNHGGTHEKKSSVCLYGVLRRPVKLSTPPSMVMKPGK